MTPDPTTRALACVRQEIAQLSALLHADPALDGLVQPPPREAGHALLGAARFGHWGLPAEFASTVLNHHQAIHDGATPGHQLPAVADRCAHFHPDRLPEGEPVAASDLLLIGTLTRKRRL